MRKEIEQKLIERSCAGDAEAFNEIYFLLKDSIYGFAFRMTKQNQIAEEITQEVFMFFIENSDKYETKKGSLFSFLCGVTRNKVLNYLKKSGTRLESNNLDAESFENITKDNGNSPFKKLLDKEFFKKIEESVSELSPLQREVILLREMDDLSYEEIADITQSNIGVVKGRLYRARQTLAKKLAPYIKNEEEVNTYEVHRS